MTEWQGPLNYYDALNTPTRCEASGEESNPTVHSGTRFCLDHYPECATTQFLIRARRAAQEVPVQLDMLDLLNP